MQMPAWKPKEPPHDDGISIFKDAPPEVRLTAWQSKMNRDKHTAWAKPVVYVVAVALTGAGIYLRSEYQEAKKIARTQEQQFIPAPPAAKLPKKE